MDYASIIQKMTAGILEQVKFGIDTKSHSDKTFKAKVTELISADKYKVQYCGCTYTVSSPIICNVGDSVRVCAPCNNWNDLYIAENKTAYNALRAHYKGHQCPYTLLVQGIDVWGIYVISSGNVVTLALDISSIHIYRGLSLPLIEIPKDVSPLVSMNYNVHADTDGSTNTGWITIAADGIVSLHYWGYKDEWTGFRAIVTYVI